MELAEVLFVFFYMAFTATYFIYGLVERLTITGIIWRLNKHIFQKKHPQWHIKAMQRQTNLKFY